MTNDLVYDQRMHRICSSLSNDYEILLVGRERKVSKNLAQTPYRTKRLKCLFDKGKLFYLEYNIRLFFYLMGQSADCICAIDLDTIVPCYFISRLKRIHRVYDAHEFFTQLDEVVSRPPIHRVWQSIEKTMVPRFRQGYTVSEGIAHEFRLRYGVEYELIRNMPKLSPTNDGPVIRDLVIYQGAVNHGRGLDQLVMAMKQVNGRLLIAGDGNYMGELRSIVKRENLDDKVELKGMMRPDELWSITPQARVGVNPFTSKGMNQFLSLSNKFFDYIHALVPQVTMNYPEYREINKETRVAILIDNTDHNTLAQGINEILHNEKLYGELRQNCRSARDIYNWNNEEEKLKEFYRRLFK